MKLSGHESSRSRSAPLELADASEPDWLRDFASNKRGRDAADREQRRKVRRAEARRRAAEADRAFFAGARSVGGAFGGGGKNPEARASSTVSRRGMKPPRRRRLWRRTPRRCPAARPGTTPSRRLSSWRMTGRTRPGRRRAPFAATTRRRTKRRISFPSPTRFKRGSSAFVPAHEHTQKSSLAWTFPTRTRTISHRRRSSSAAARTRS